jgi:outer membrane protein assembly factor BamB
VFRNHFAETPLSRVIVMHRTATGILAVLALLLGGGADWRHFRGTDVTGLTSDPPPTAWSGTAPVQWTQPLSGRGLSSPIVVGDRVIVTCSSGPTQERLHVMVFAADRGEPLWERQFWATGRTVCHDKTCVAAPTPASDGERIFAFYSTNDVVCLDMDGNLLWFRGLTWDYPNASNSLGMASSPVVADETLIVMVENDAESFSAGLDAQTGETRWKLDRPRSANWSSPVLLSRGTGRPPLVLLQSSQGVVALEPRTGQQLWSYDDGASTTPSSVVSGEIVYVPSNGITALRPGRSNPEVPEIVWNEGSLQPGTSSPVFHQGRLYVVNNGGVLTCASGASGERLWQLRLRGKFSGSPVIAGDHLFIVNEEGTVFSVQLGEQSGEIAATHDFGETVLCTPALADGALYVRSDGHLWKIAGR